MSPYRTEIMPDMDKVSKAQGQEQPNGSYELIRFLRAQEYEYSGYEVASQEVANGRKRKHWIWYIFPQIKGLGHSDYSEYYGIGSLEEATAYLRHEVLGKRLKEISNILLQLEGKTINEIFEGIDATKVRSSMTLFDLVAPDDIFAHVLEKYFGGQRCELTLEHFAADGKAERYLFLDIDGVLNTGNYSNYLVENRLCETDADGYMFDPEAVKNLRYIIKATNAKIVITSTWRLDGLKAMQELWEHRDMPNEVFGITPQLKTAEFNDIDSKETRARIHPIGSRGMEIDEWLRQYASKRTKPYAFAILDDENDYLLHQGNHVVLTDPLKGITKEVADKIVQILKQQ